MNAPEINATQIKSFLRCRRLWAFQYLNGIQSVGDAVAFGTRVHEHAEKYLRSGEYPRLPGVPFEVRKGNGQSRTHFPAVIAHKGLRLCPPPMTPDMRVESGWKVIDPVSGIAFKGTMDFFLPARSGWEVQIETVPVDGPLGREPRTRYLPLIGDHKTCAGAKWALDAHTLPSDIQLLLYAWAEFVANPEETHVKARWIYYSKSPREPEGWAVDVVVSREWVEAEFDRIIRPAARAIVAESERLGMAVVDPRHPPAGYPLDSRPVKLHVLNSIPYEGHTDSRCEDYGGCWYRGFCFNFDLQSSERRGGCGDECTEGTCANRPAPVENTSVEPAGGNSAAPSSESHHQGETQMAFTNNTDPTAVASFHARIAAEGLAPGWNFYPAPHGDYVYNTAVAGDRPVHVSEYLATFHPAAPPAVNPPPPAAPAMPPAPSAPAAPPSPAAPPAPSAPAAPGAPAAPPAAPKPSGAGASEEQQKLFAECVAAGYIPAGRPGKKPAIHRLRALLAWKWSLETLAAHEKATADSSDENAKSALRAAFVAFGMNDSAPEAPPAAETPAPAPEAPPAAPGAPPAATPAPEAPKPGKAPSKAPKGASVAGYILAINVAANGAHVDFNREVLPVLNERIAGLDIPVSEGGPARRFPSYDAVPFNRGVPYMNAALGEYLGTVPAGTVIVVDAGTPAGRDALDTLRAGAAMILRGY